MRTGAAGGSVAPRGDRGGAGPGRAVDPGPAQRGQGAELRQRLGVRECRDNTIDISLNNSSAGRRLRRRELRHGAAVLPLQVRPPPPGRAEGRVCRRQVGLLIIGDLRNWQTTREWVDVFYTLVYSEATLLPTYLGHTGTTIHYDEDNQVTQYKMNPNHGDGAMHCGRRGSSRRSQL